MCGQGRLPVVNRLSLLMGTGTANIRTGPLSIQSELAAVQVATAASAAVLALTIVNRSNPQRSRPLQDEVESHVGKAFFARKKHRDMRFWHFADTDRSLNFSTFHTFGRGSDPRSSSEGLVPSRAFFASEGSLCNFNSTWESVGTIQAKINSTLTVDAVSNHSKRGSDGSREKVGA